jgi:predicted Fe-Mo cluster-binding NifX family protein
MAIGMKLAITAWHGRISPLFDVSRHIVVAETEGYGKPVTVVASAENESPLPKDKVAALSMMGVEAVVCGAISREFEEAVLDAGIELDAFVSGDVEDVLRAWSEGSLRQRRFSMPGCPCPRHRCMRGNQQGRPKGHHGRW